MRIFTGTLLVLFAAVSVNALLAFVLVRTTLLDRWKLQPRPFRPGEVRARLPLVARTFLSTSLAAAIGFSLGEGRFLAGGTPTFLRVLRDVATIFLFHDVWVYFLHRTLHRNETLFRKVHAVHHRAHHPMPLDYLYLHPLEGALGSIGMLAAIALLAPIPIESLWAYLFLIHLHEGHIHWGLRSLLPFRIPLLATIAHHDLHHSKPRLGTNFAPNGSSLDRLFGTETDPDALRPPRPRIAVPSLAEEVHP